MMENPRIKIVSRWTEVRQSEMHHQSQPFQLENEEPVRAHPEDPVPERLLTGSFKFRSAAAAPLLGPRGTVAHWHPVVPSASGTRWHPVPVAAAPRGLALASSSTQSQWHPVAHGALCHLELVAQERPFQHQGERGTQSLMLRGRERGGGREREREREGEREREREGEREEKEREERTDSTEGV
jgi:hypothetical protein